MRRILGIAGLAAMGLFAAACDSTNTSGGSSPSTGAAKSSYTFYMVTHGDNGTFWSVVQKGEKAAASDLGVAVNYQGSNNDDTQECQFISAAVTAKPDGLVVSPHSETDLVVDNAKSNVSSATATLQAKLSADTSIDSILALDPDVAKNIVEAAVAGASSKAKIATFDLSAGVVADIQSGKIDFAVDQQQYLQGYLPVVFLKLYKSNANTVGGFDTVKSGPGIVDKTNASQVASLAGQGTR